MTRTISPRTVALLAAHVDLRRLRVAYRHDDQVYDDLLLLTVIAHAGSASGTEIAIQDDPNGASDLTAAEAAAQAGVSTRAIRKAIAQGRLAATWRGRQWSISTEALARWCIRRAA